MAQFSANYVGCDKVINLTVFCKHTSMWGCVTVHVCALCVCEIVSVCMCV